MGIRKVSVDEIGRILIWKIVLVKLKIPQNTIHDLTSVVQQPYLTLVVQHCVILFPAKTEILLPNVFYFLTEHNGLI